jgi:hypothetical protein
VPCVVKRSTLFPIHSPFGFSWLYKQQQQQHFGTFILFSDVVCWRKPIRIEARQRHQRALSPTPTEKVTTRQSANGKKPIALVYQIVVCGVKLFVGFFIFLPAARQYSIICVH